MLLAIPVEGFNPDYIDPFSNGLVLRIANLLDPLSRLFSFENFDSAKDLETQLPWIVDQDHRHPIVGHQVAGADVLLVSAKVGKSHGSFVDHFQKALRAAPVLNVRPTGRA